MDKAALKRRAGKDMAALVKDSLYERFEQAAVEVQDIILQEYDDELVDVVTDRDSRTNPNYYRDEFQARLEAFDYIEESGDDLTFNVPDMENFDWSGRLRVIQVIMEGLLGEYVEMDEEEYKSVFNKKPVAEQSLDEYVPPKMRIYLIKYNATVRQSEKELNKKFVRYPFSNTPSINVMDEGEEYTNDNMDRWIKEAFEEAQKKFVNRYKGVK